MTPNDRALRMLGMAAFGMSYRQIAAEFGISCQRVSQVLNKVSDAQTRQAFKDEHLARDWDTLPDHSKRYRSPRCRWPREKMADFKRKNGFCIHQGCTHKASAGHTRCRVHLDYLKARVAPYVKALQARRRAEGLCTHCDEPPEPGYRMCARHRALSRRNQQRYKDKQRREQA